MHLNRLLTTCLCLCMLATALRASVHFRANAGQWPATIHFGLEAGPAHIAFHADGVTWTLRQGDQTHSYHTRFIGARPDLAPIAEGAPTSAIRYLQGGQRPLHTSDYAAIRYPEVWPGIDILYYGAPHPNHPDHPENRTTASHPTADTSPPTLPGNKTLSDPKTPTQTLKYDLIVRPHADPTQIRLAIEAVDQLNLLPDGRLQFQTPAGTFHEAPPYTYQEHQGEKITIPSRYTQNAAGEIQFEFPEGYDPAWPLTIDPVVQEWGTYVRSASPSNGFMGDFVLDDQGNIYAVGTYSGGFGTLPGASHNFSTQGVDLVVYKLDPTGSNLIWATYLGGDRGERGNGIIRDPAGNIYITGRTRSHDFPTTAGSFQPGHGDGQFYNEDVFVAKLSPNGDSILYASYYGGLGDDYASDIDVNAAGEAFVGGYTNGGQIPTTPGAYDETFNGAPGFSDIFVFRVSADGSNLIYSTFLGGTQSESVSNIIVNDRDEASISGEMNSPDYPTTPNALYNRNTGSVGTFVTRLSADGSSLEASTYFAGGNADYGEGLALNAAGDFYLTGRTYSNFFPLSANAYDSTHNGGIDLFVVRISADATTMQYSTFFGGTQNDIGTGIAVNELGEIFVTGNTRSFDFPTTTCTIDSTFAGGNAYWGGDLFLIKLDSSGDRLLYSTILGGAGDEFLSKLALDNAACTRGVVLGTNSQSIDFPTTANSFMPTNPTGTGQPTFTRLGEELEVNIVLPPDPCPVTGEPFDLGLEITGCGHWTDFRKMEWRFGDGIMVRDSAPSHTFASNGTYTVELRRPGCPEVLDETVLNLFGLDLGPDLQLCPGQDVTLDASIPQATSYRWYDGATTATHRVDKSGALYVDVMDNRGCTASDTVWVTVLDEDEVQVPNVFTPNDDGINDRFFVTGLGTAPWTLEVYDRWGKLRFRDAAYQNDWQGGDLPEGVYYYILQSNLTCGTFFGHVTLMR